jgi:tetratricopeptide (TPR) repeat protein
MTPERWQQVQDVLDKALELAPDQRSAYLNQACPSDPSLRQEVETLLVSSEGVRSSFLQSLSLADEVFADAERDGPSRAGQFFADRFQLIRKLGEGGMGQVWLAEQTSPVQRQVALKLIKAGRYDEAMVHRFQAERQSLAIMDHPAIAKVFDAGVTPQGQPFFVMEYVPGLPITEYCDQKKLGIRERLHLFIQACEGVQHAHQKAIIHRDLKPANVLVVDVDGKPVPRIIDFGLAKSVMPHKVEENLFTQTGHFVGTPGYMSPEQADSTVRDIDTRTDVYSLGVVLYVLLAGVQPFETKQQPLDEWLRRLREQEPPRPSTSVDTDRETAISNAEARGTEPKQLVSLLRGDLDCITMKAMEKDRARRYGAPSELTDDIRRYLNQELVVARPASAAYRSGKFIKRHKVALAVTAAFALVLMAGAVVVVREARIARMQQARAERRFESLRKLTNSLLFEFHDSIKNLPGSTKARELVVRRALEYLGQIEAEANGDPATLRDLAAAYDRLGQILSEQLYAHLGGAGSVPEAKQLYEKALAIRQSQAAMNPGDLSLQDDLVDTMWDVADIYRQLGDLDGALETHQKRLAILERLVASHDSEDLKRDIAHSLIAIGNLKASLGDYQEAADCERRALTLSQALLDSNPTNDRLRYSVMVSHCSLASVLNSDKRYPEAIGETRKALAIATQLSAQDPNDMDLQRFLAEIDVNLCTMLSYAGLFSEARSRCRSGMARNEKMEKADENNAQASSDVASAYSSTGLALYLMHSPREAMSFEQRADSLYNNAAVRDPDSIGDTVDHAVSLIYLGRAEADLHRPELARKSLERAQQMLERAVERSPENHDILNTLDEARAVINALPDDTAPIFPH